MPFSIDCFSSWLWITFSCFLFYILWMSSIFSLLDILHDMWSAIDSVIFFWQVLFQSTIKLVIDIFILWKPDFTLYFGASVFVFGPLF